MAQIKRIKVLNDTGSDLLTLFYADLPYLGNYYQYEGWQQDVDVHTITLESVKFSLTLELKIKRAPGRPEKILNRF